MADEKQYLSRIRLVDGTTVDIKDQEARIELNNLADHQADTDDQVVINKNDIIALFEQIQWGEF